MGSNVKGIARAEKERKRQEAEARNKKTPHNRTKAHRLGLCGVEHNIIEVWPEKSSTDAG